MVVQLAAEARVEGRLVGAGEAGDYVVALAPTQRGPATATLAARPGPDGRFVFVDLQPGEYGIVARRFDDKRRWATSEAFLIETVGGTVTEIDLPVAEEKP